MAELLVMEAGHPIGFSFEDLLKYHGRGFPGGVAHGFKVMQRALPLLDDGQPPERRDIAIETAFPGPGARDAFELVTRAMTDGRYRVDATLAGDDVLESPKGRYFFRFRYRGRAVALTLRPGHVREEFVALGRKESRTEAEEARLAHLKEEMAARLMGLPAEVLYTAAVSDG